MKTLKLFGILFAVIFVPIVLLLLFLMNPAVYGYIAGVIYVFLLTYAVLMQVLRISNDMGYKESNYEDFTKDRMRTL